MSAHDPQYYEAQRILNELPTDQATQLFKTTRSGATTGICATAFDVHKKVTIIAPTINISVDTFDKSTNYTDIAPESINITNIPGNRACMLIDNMVKEYPDLDKLAIIPLPLKCSECKHNDECKVTKFLRSDNPNGVGLTTQKLSALMHSSAETAKTMVAKLLTMSDVVIIDEAHRLETNNAATVQVYPYPDTSVYELARSKYPVIDEFIAKFDNIRKDNDETVIQQFVLNSDKSTEMLMSIGNINESGETEKYDQPAFKSVVSAIKNIVDIMKKRKDFGLSVAQVVYLSDIIMTLSGSHLVMHYVKTDEGAKDTDTVSLSSPGGQRNAIREYIMQVNLFGKSKIVFTTGTFGDFYYGNMFGININQMMMEDTRKTNEKMTIHPDTFRISTYDYWREGGHAYKPKIINRIIEYHEKHPDAKFVCMKKSVARTIKKWMHDLGHNIAVDYYGSANMIGTDYDGRVLVCIGAPVCSINAHDGISTSYTESQKTRINGNHAAFWQAISRAKDPSGVEESHVYCIGIREKEIRMMCTWGVDRHIETDGIQCLSVSVKDGVENSVGMPNIESVAVRHFIGLLQKQKDADRSYLMQRMNITAAELDKLLLHPDIGHCVSVTKTKKGRKSKKVYNLI